MDRSIGIVGAGRMGGAMWRHLHSLGHTAVVFDVSEDAVAALVAEGAAGATSAREVAANADIVICSLPRSDDVATALLGHDGVVSGASNGTLVIDTTSGAPSQTREITAACAARGVAYIDAGVSGGPHGAGSGTLNIMVGGSDHDFATAKPVLDLLGQNIWHCGAPGTGHAMKTVLNLSNQAKMFIEIEALLVGRAAGLDAGQMAEVLGLGAWRAFLMAPEGRRRFGFSLGMSCKDYDVGLGVATEEQVPVPGITAVTEAMRVILDEIGPDADIIDYVTVLERNARVELPNHPKEQDQ
jgi:3-hydroxyisobutyrate dehydrogenase-like beta-hydroxyacid dehydrogenase